MLVACGGTLRTVSNDYALVTGASTGIGRACALRLDREGWRVFAGVRRTEDGERLSASASARLRPVTLDVTNEDQVAEVFQTVADEVGARGLRALVNNAGVAIGGPLEYLPTDRWREQFEVNVFGQITVSRYAMPLLRRTRGRLVFIGSNSGRVAAPLMGPYTSSKFAIEGIADSLRLELFGSGIDVVVIQPGAVKTDIWGKGRSQVEDVTKSLPDDALATYGPIVEAIKAGIDSSERTGVQPEAVADVVMRAVTARRPRTRYQVGVDSKVSVAAARVLPGRLLDPILRAVVKP